MYHKTRSSCSSYDTVTTAVSGLSQSTSWSGTTTVDSVGRGRYPAVPKLAFPTVLEAGELDSPTHVNSASHTSSQVPARRPTRPSGSFSFPPDCNSPPSKQLRFSINERAHLQAWSSASSLACSTSLKEKGLLRRLLKDSFAQVRTLSSGSLSRLRSLSCHAGCSRASVYDPVSVVPGSPPTILEPASAPSCNTNPISRLILQMPPAEPLLPAVLAAGEDVALDVVDASLSIVELGLVITAEGAYNTKLPASDREREASHPDSEILPSNRFDVFRRKQRPSLPPSLYGPLVTSSRRDSRPQFTYI
ncbi:hypothetical protein CspeluHIS016_0302720 [Cutaneotrichosporon spelunceum]|uniref:Uncharacterized protein n=1 Tax=Cutaneotrichosporon spelunceum TaxID=1672016 RepID=A0AAD3TT55_9TREE|nr:hypothetical protein CspeluHIS016_0302720 [Cutaneotrichosporon spelunceum]